MQPAAGRTSRRDCWRSRCTPRSASELAPNETAIEGDIVTDSAAAMDGVDCVIHLAGIPREAGGTPEQILQADVIGTHAVFAAARAAAVRRFVSTSSNHVIGCHPADRTIGAEEPPRPSGVCGASKVHGEALGRLPADKFGMQVACRRIGAFRARPGHARELGGWLSHGDAQRLFRAA
jgi:uronate dehydrogenase